MNRAPFSLLLRYAAPIGLATLVGSLVDLPLMASAQDLHPKKKIFADVPQWPTTSPGDVQLKNFAPFRAVYDRTYRQGAGPNAGDTRRDRVIVTAEDVGWDGRKAAAITIIDSGVVEHSDTNARVTAMFVDLSDLSGLFEIGPIPGKGKDYYIGRVDEDAVSLNMITTDTQTLETKKIETSDPGFGPSAWVMASMNLRKGLKINLSPFFSPPATSLASTRLGYVVGQEDFEEGSGKNHEAWVIETSRNPSTPRVSHVYLIDRPPYYLGTETVDLDTRERKRFVWLRGFEKLED